MADLERDERVKVFECLAAGRFSEAAEIVAPKKGLKISDFSPGDKKALNESRARIESERTPHVPNDPPIRRPERTTRHG